MKRVKVLASVQSHMPFLSVLAYSGVSRSYGLEISVDTVGQKKAPKMEDRSKVLLRGDYQFLSGLHHEPYFFRARGDKRLTYLAQGQNLWDDRLIVVPEISSPKQLEGKSIFVHGAAPCTMGNLKKVLRDSGVNISLVKFVTDRAVGETGDFTEALESYVGSKVQGALVDMPFDLVAKKRGFKVLALPDRPVVHNVTVCASSDYINKNEGMVTAFLKSFIAAVHFFKTERSKTIDIIEERVAPVIGIEGHEDEISHLYDGWKKLLSAKPYPLPEAIQNTFDLDAARDPRAKKLNAIEPWDLHYLKEIDDSGFIDGLYAAS